MNGSDFKLNISINVSDVITRETIKLCTKTMAPDENDANIQNKATPN